MSMGDSSELNLTSLVKRKGVGTRAWLVVSELGKSRIEEVGKHSIMRRTGIPVRDLRILDPALSYPSTILGRERAIVVNLEHVKAIITATEMLILNYKDPSVATFVSNLECKLSNFDASQSPAKFATYVENLLDLGERKWYEGGRELHSHLCKCSS